jgi:hypothetical protein
MAALPDINGDAVEELVHLCLESVAGEAKPAICATDVATGVELWRQDIPRCP